VAHAFAVSEGEPSVYIQFKSLKNQNPTEFTVSGKTRFGTDPSSTGTLKPVLLELQRRARERWLDVRYEARVNFKWKFLLTAVALCVQS
jgi:hypothetical protein